MVDTKNLIKNTENAKEINIKNANIKFKDVLFSYKNSDGDVLKEINLEFEGGKMTSLSWS